jgi:putative transposase
VRQLPEEDPLTVRVCELASQYGRYGYRRVTALLRSEGWKVNHKRVERIWRQAGLKVPQKQQKRRRLWLKRYGEHSPEADSQEPCMEL